ncbi:MAG: helix-turn-helix domain-containing protein [Alphaproteobacteria bacterium]|nr:helix-turn-helix domain-containing protein [Alphaproteobacteria bacterium]
MYEIPRDRKTASPNVFRQTCPARFLLGRVAGKWSMLVIDALQDGPTRNGALMRRIEGISQKMLTQTLRELEDLQLLSRQDMKTVPPHVEYELTPLGRELHTMVCAMDRWIEQNMFELIDGSEAIPLTER